MLSNSEIEQHIKKLYRQLRCKVDCGSVDSFINIYNSNGTIPDNTDRVAAFDPVLSSLTFGDIGGGQLSFGELVAGEGIIRLLSQNNDTKIKAFDTDDTNYSILDLSSDFTNPTAPIARVARTDEATYDLGFSAFYDVVADTYTSNIYYFDIATSNDLWRIGGLYDAGIPADSYIEWHIHTDFSNPASSKNGSYANQDYTAMFFNSTDEGGGTNGYSLSLDANGFHFMDDSTELMSVNSAGTVILGENGNSFVSIESAGRISIISDTPAANYIQITASTGLIEIICDNTASITTTDFNISVTDLTINGNPGVDFNGAITNLTIEKGIVTAAS